MQYCTHRDPILICTDFKTSRTEKTSCATSGRLTKTFLQMCWESVVSYLCQQIQKIKNIRQRFCFTITDSSSKRQTGVGFLGVKNDIPQKNQILTPSYQAPWSVWCTLSTCLAAGHSHSLAGSADTCSRCRWWWRTPPCLPSSGGQWGKFSPGFPHHHPSPGLPGSALLCSDTKTQNKMVKSLQCLGEW